MRIVVLEPIYFKGLHLDRLKKLGSVSLSDNFPVRKADIIQKIMDADIVITAATDLDADIISQCKSLKMICLACTGFDRVDIGACVKQGIVVANVPFYASESVAEHAVALLLTLAKKIREGDMQVRQGKFDRKGLRLLQLSGKVFGIIGTGRIGSRVARIASCFGCRVIAHSAHPSIEREKELGIQYVELKELLMQSDIISLHVPLTRGTRDLISHKEFRLMGKRPILINTSRGEVIDKEALVEALREGMISGAGLDVMASELLRKKDPLLKFPNVVCSPHNAFCTAEALERRAETITTNIEAFIRGSFQNIVEGTE